MAPDVQGGREGDPAGHGEVAHEIQSGDEGRGRERRRGRGRPKPEVMAELGIASLAPLKAWCRAWREGGAEALRPRPKGRPRGSGPEAAPKTREQELEERVRRLEAEVADLKNCAP